MGEWGPDGFGRNNRPNSFQEACEKLSPKAKQAFFAAAQHQTIHRGTWNGCAFNAGASESGFAGVSTVSRAAQVFEMDSTDVSTFIAFWDNSRYENDKEATKALKNILQEVGLFTEPVGAQEFAGKSFVKVIHKSDLETMREEFDKMVDSLDIDDSELSSDMREFKEATQEARELLFA